MADGRNYLTPEGVGELPDSNFAKYLTDRDIKPTPAKIRGLKREIQDQFRSYFYDRSGVAVLEPDAKTKATLFRGTKPGTVEGEFFRFIGQFKSFTVSVLQRPIAREIYGRGEQVELKKALMNGNGEMLGLANLIAWNTAFGYLALSAKDIAKGREPRDPLSHKTFMASMVQGGGMGIYGDFIFGDMKSRFGGGPISTLMGPTASSFGSLVDLGMRLRDGDPVAAQTLNFMVNHTPGGNLFYTRWALDYLILNQIRENLSPGYLRRQEKRMKEELDQEFIVPPRSVNPLGL